MLPGLSARYLKFAERSHCTLNSKGGFYKTAAGLLRANKYNFLRLDCLLRERMPAVEEVDPFSVFPTDNILMRWMEYISTMNARLSKFCIQILLDDRELAQLLLGLSKIKETDDDTRQDVLMALGAICEDTFIGPSLVVVDLLHRCNTNCLHCWIHAPSTQEKDIAYLRQTMGIDMFRNIAVRAKKIGTRQISLLANGEPLMHPNIKDAIRICRDNGLGFETVTNGVFMNDALSKLMVDSGIAIVTVSLPAASRLRYHQICPMSPMSDFEKIRHNIRSLVEYKNTSKGTTQIQITHVIHSLNCYDLSSFVDMDIDLGVDAVTFKPIQIEGHNAYLKLTEPQVDYLKTNLPASIKKLENHGIRTDHLSTIYLDYYNNRDGLRTKDFFKDNGCLTGWVFCNIQAAGEVLFCCGNKMVGSLQRSDFDTIWFSDEYNSYRIAAKRLEQEGGTRFVRGEELFDDKCHSCENINQHLHMLKIIKRYSLEKFL